jgi:hypothetical protein
MTFRPAVLHCVPLWDFTSQLSLQQNCDRKNPLQKLKIIIKINVP